ncbi:MAG: methyltransferase regulatory domain-containing protein, partial [Actinomyces oris]
MDGHLRGVAGHDHLEPHNDPCYFYQFNDHLKAHNLAYVCD